MTPYIIEVNWHSRCT